MYYVYFLKSLLNNDLYVGSTENVTTRVRLHNSGKIKSTKAYKPWELLEYKEYSSRREAVRFERFYKNHQQKELLKSKHGLIPK